MIKIKGYKLIHSYRKHKNKRAKRCSGGLLVYIKEQYCKGVKLVKNEVDFIIWIKLDKNVLYAI